MVKQVAVVLVGVGVGVALVGEVGNGFQTR